jgi:hypothetical protein
MLRILPVRIIQQVGLWLLQSIIHLFLKIFGEVFFVFRRILVITKMSLLGSYRIDWMINYVELQQIPNIRPDKQAIQILAKVKD